MDKGIISKMILEELEDSESDLSSCSDTTDSSDMEILMKVVPFSFDQDHMNSFLEEIIPSNSDTEFYTNFRISQTLYRQLVDMFSTSDNYTKLEKNKTYSPEMQIGLFLWFAGHEKCSYRDIANRFKLALRTVCSAMHRVLYFISNLSESTIRWPTEEEQLETSQAMRSKTGIQGVIGIIACTRIQINFLNLIDGDTNIDTKKMSSLCIQGICNEKGKFINIFVGSPGFVPDNEALKNSDIYRELPKSCGNKFLLGGNGYACSQHLITPYRHNRRLTKKQKFFNQKLNSGRILIDQSFGRLKQRFKQLNHCTLEDIDKLCHFIRACAVLHNLSNDEEFPFEMNEINEEDVHFNITVDQEQNFTLRDRLCEEVFTYFN